MDARDRGRLMNKLADLIEQNIDELAALETLDNGKPISESRNADLPLSIDCFRYYAGWADKIHGQTIPIRGQLLLLHPARAGRRRRADHPLELPAADGGLEVGPGPGRRLHGRAEAGRADAADLPCAWASWPRRPASPTASSTSSPATARPPAPPSSSTRASTRSPSPARTETGQIIMRNAADTLKRVTLRARRQEPEHRLRRRRPRRRRRRRACSACYFNQGQCCCAGSRLFVEEKVHDEFVEKLADEDQGAARSATRSTRPPSRARRSTRRSSTRSCGYIEQRQEARAPAASPAASGIGDKGYFIEPTVFADVQGRHGDRQAKRSSAR